MVPPATRSKPPQAKVTTAEAFYRIFCVLSKRDRLSVARYIFQDVEIRQHLDLPEIPNDVTLKAFAEDKTGLPAFETIQELREDLLS